MTYLAVGLLFVVYAALMLRVAFWLGGLLRDAEVFLERANAGQCHCTRHRLCAVCLAELRAPQSERSAA